jgi:hypothetical protein
MFPARYRPGTLSNRPSDERTRTLTRDGMADVVAERLGSSPEREFTDTIHRMTPSRRHARPGE